MIAAKGEDAQLTGSIVVKQPGSIEGVGTACAKTSGWMAMCCKPNPVCHSPFHGSSGARSVRVAVTNRCPRPQRGKKYACELPRRGFWSGSPQYPDRGHSSPREEEWPVEAEAGATFHGDQPNWREETGRRGRLGAGPGSRQGSRGWGESGEWPAESKTGPSYSEGPREWTNEEEYGPRESDPRPEFGGESVGWTEAEEYRPREAGRGPETDEYRPREAGQGPGLRDGDRWSEDRYRPRERTGSRFRDDSSRWSEPDSEPEEYRPTHSEAGSGFRDWPRWTEEEYQPSKSKSQSGSRGRGGGSSGRGRGRSKKTGSRRGSRGGRWSSEVEQWE